MTLRWGILGTGYIAKQFAENLASSRRGRLRAVASRSESSAAAFAREFDSVRAWGSYEQLLTDQEVDAVYIALPNSMHMPWTLDALRAGKHVLCEKPMASNTKQAGQMFAEAAKANRVLVEAFMYRSHPLMKAVWQQVQQGVIGPLRLIRSSFCDRAENPQEMTCFDRKLAGGSLMDIGCYCLNFSRHFAQAEPDSFNVTGRLYKNSVDELTTGTLSFPNGILAQFTCGMCLEADNSAMLCGENGYIEIPTPWQPPMQQASFNIAKKTGAGDSLPTKKTYYVDADRPLYALEADDFAAVVLDGVPPTITQADTIGNMVALDRLRAEVGVCFEDDQQ